MFDFLSDFFFSITWRKSTHRGFDFLCFFANLGIVSLILVKLPADHFSKSRKRFWRAASLASRREGDWEKTSPHFTGRAGYRPVVAGRAGTRLVHCSSRYNVARLSGKDVWNRSC